MATSPAMTPFSAMLASGFLNIHQEVIIAAIAPAAAARLVVVAMWAMSATAPMVLPGLKPNQPNQRINTPRVARGMLCPGMTFAVPSPLYLPILGPNITAPVSASQPPVE